MDQDNLIKTCGGVLRDARIKKGVDLDQVAKELDIPVKYLEALEDNNFKSLPGKDYAKDFLKKYCDYLNISFNDLWHKIKKLDLFCSFNSVAKVENKYLLAWPKIIRKIIICLLIVAFVIFLGVKIKQIFAPPDLIIMEPINKLITDQQQIKVFGRSEPEVELMVNNREIFVDNQGNFEAEIDLQNGVNLIKISAKKRYSRTNNLELEILFKE